VARLKFRDILATAQLHKGGARVVESMLPEVVSAKALAKLPDSFFLSTMCRRVFRAGLKHSLVDKKWPAFEKAFHEFDTFDIAMMSDEMLEAQMQNRDIIRHLGKIKSIRTNALMIRDLSQEHQGFGSFLAQWPDDELCELWFLLKKRGAQLGGLSSPRFLRMVGRDTFILTDDVVSSLKAQGIIEKNPSSQRDIRLAQLAFNAWQQESGLPMSHISRIISFTANVS